MFLLFRSSLIQFTSFLARAAVGNPVSYGSGDAARLFKSALGDVEFDLNSPAFIARAFESAQNMLASSERALGALSQSEPLAAMIPELRALRACKRDSVLMLDRFFNRDKLAAAGVPVLYLATGAS